MKKTTIALVLVIGCAFAAPAFANFTTTSGVKQAQPEQIAKGGSHGHKSGKAPKGKA